MIHVIATIELEPGLRNQFLSAFHELVPLVHAEKGCIEYGPTVDVETGLGPQLPLREDVVTVVEKWETIEDLKAHLAAPHMDDYRQKVHEIVKGMQIQVLKPA
ncbi:antibiotic biosynthesis monooxygenase [Blastopirellula sp. JC732]|uniref:Antibiotic biosynthesis monooxygenase n=1 Tax=Blastopirellula sediminis TaxID=2894196 RepID=A0A9X1MQ85_9BACT|nr:putative quinol monooxygenase [Blastopirellula sediminis]MCC9605242.1 antibiotic biosynthesis monooxygenase [Blastopirellula sediminis]MCC9631458.1 antibiotic biosynthesis monooxygenase [Blastopirellula sediminis]